MTNLNNGDSRPITDRVGDATVTGDDTSVTLEQGHPTGEEGRPRGEEDRPTGEEGRPRGEEGRPTGEEGRPTGEEGRPTGEEGRPTGEKGRPSGEDRPTGEKGRPSGEDRPTGEKGMSTGEEGRSTGEECRPSGEEDRPTGEECRVPKDTGWAWCVLLGVWLEIMLVIGVVKSAGIVFVAFQERFNATSSMTSLLSTIQNAVYSMTAPFVLSIGKRVTTSRKLVFIGTTLLTSAYIITSQAKDMRILLFSHGVLQGLGTAFIQPVGIVTLASYFDKRRGFANSLSTSGSSIGGLVFAPLITFLLHKYGYQGCFLIMAGVLANGFVSASLFRAHSFYKRKNKKTFEKESDKAEKESLIEQNANHLDVKLNKEHALELTHPNGTSNGTSDTGAKVPLHRATLDGVVIEHLGVRKRTITQSSYKSQLSNIGDSLTKLNGSMNYMCGSMMDVTLAGAEENTSEETNDKNKTNTKTSIKTLLRSLLASFDFKLFKNPLFCVMQLASFIICANTALSTVFIAPHARDVGIPSDKIALIVTVYSATDLASRLIIASIVDRGWIRRSNITAFTVFTIGVAANFVRFYNSFEMLMLYAVINGLFAGVYFSLFPVLIMDYLGIQKLQATFGFTTLFHGAGVSLFFYIIGTLRDVTGSYVLPFNLMGSLNLLGSALHFALPFVERYWERNHPKETNNA